VNHSIPAFFGYFASGEFLDQALTFYLNVVARASYEQATAIVRPYFVSCSLFPFFESVILPFFESFLTVNFISQVAALARLVEWKGPVIGRHHRVLFQLLEQKFGTSDSTTFLVDVFRDFFTLFVASGWHTISTDDFITRLRRSDAFCQALNRSFGDTTVSSFEVPPIFSRVVERSSELHISVSIREFLVLVRAANQLIQGLPAWVQRTAGRLTSLDDSLMIAIKYCQDESPWHSVDSSVAIFPHFVSRIPFEYDPDRERARDPDYEMRKAVAHLQDAGIRFEAYMCAVAGCRRMKGWRAVVSAHQFHAFAPVSVFWPGWKNRRLARARFFAALEACGIMAGQRARMKKLATTWVTVVRATEKECRPQEMFSRASLTSAFCRCIELFRRAEVQPLAETFGKVLQAAKTLRQLAEFEGMIDQELVRKAVALSQSEVFPEFYLIVSKFAIGAPDFQRLCSSKELECWFLFEGAMLAAISANPGLTALFFAIRSSLEERPRARSGP
jgi:hypothetical protein